MFAFFSIGVNADTKLDKIKKLMEIQGQIQMWQEAIDSAKKQSESLAATQIDQLMARLNPPPNFKKKFNDATKVYIAKVQAPWTATEIVNTYAGYYAPQFTEEELDELLDFYSSDLGSKDISATRHAMSELRGYYQKARIPIFDKATKEYMDELQLVARQCKCEKKAEKKNGLRL